MLGDKQEGDHIAALNPWLYYWLAPSREALGDRMTLNFTNLGYEL